MSNRVHLGKVEYNKAEIRQQLALMVAWVQFAREKGAEYADQTMKSNLAGWTTKEAVAVCNNQPMPEKVPEEVPPDAGGTFAAAASTIIAATGK